MYLVKKQQGVGLVEVLVALLLLAVGILGFIALQYRAVEASAEATNRVQAMNLARDLTEKMRVNDSTNAITSYKTNLQNQENQKTAEDCYAAFCTPANKAKFDVNQTYLQAQRLGMKVQMQTCPETANGRQCIYVAWDKTDPVNNTATTTGYVSCTTSTEGSFSYTNNSTCIVLEAY